jgi:hypothetical protein
MALFDNIVPYNTLVFLTGNKQNLGEDAVIAEDMDRAYIAAHKASFFDASELTGQGIEDIFVEMAIEIVRRETTGYDMQKLSSVEKKENTDNCNC